MSSHSPIIKIEERSPRPGSSHGSVRAGPVTSKRSRDSSRYDQDQTCGRPGSTASANSRSRPNSPYRGHGRSPERRRGPSRAGSPDQATNRRTAQLNHSNRSHVDHPVGPPSQRGWHKARSSGFHYGKNSVQSRPYFSQVRGRGRGRGYVGGGGGYRNSRGSASMAPPDPGRRRALLETPIGRYSTRPNRDYDRNPQRWRGSQPRGDRDSNMGTHDADYYAQDLYPLSPDGRASQVRPDRLQQFHENICETTSQSSSSSVIYNSSHKRSMEMVMRDCSPVSDDDDDGECSPKRARDEKTMTPVGPDSTTVCDLDIVKFDETISEAANDNGTDAPIVDISSPEMDFHEISRLTESIMDVGQSSEVIPSVSSTMVVVEDEKDDEVVDELIERAWDDAIANRENKNQLEEDADVELDQPTGLKIVEDVGAVSEIVVPPTTGRRMRLRSSSCPPSDCLSSSSSIRTLSRSRMDRGLWLRHLVETTRESSDAATNENINTDSSRTFADLMSLLPSAEWLTRIDLETYQTPLFLTKFSHLDPFASIRKPLQTNCSPADLTVFFDALHAVEEGDLPFPIGSRAFTQQFQKLGDGLDVAISSADWYRKTDSPDEQLGFHFLHVLKMCLLEQLRDFPDVPQPDLNVTRMALDMLLHAVIHVDGLADCMAQLGLTADLTDIIFSTIVITAHRKAACLVLEVFLLRVTQFSSLKSFGEQLRKNGTVVARDMKIAVQRVQLLLDFQIAIGFARKADCQPVAALSLRDKSLTETVQAVREDTSAKMLKAVIDAMLPYREMASKDGLDCRTALYVCLKNANFMDWYLDTLRQLSQNSSAADLRRSAVMQLMLLFLELLLEDEHGPLFLSDRSVHIADIIHVLHRIAVLSSQASITQLLQRVVYSLEVSRTISLLSSRPTVDVYGKLAVLLLHLNCSQPSTPFFLGDSTYNVISRAMPAGPEPVAKIIFSLLVSQCHRPGILNLPDLPQVSGNADAIDLPLWRSIRWISSMAKDAETCPDLLKFLNREMVKVTDAGKLTDDSLAVSHILLDTYLYLCRSDRFRSAIQNQGSNLFLKFYTIIIEHFQAVSSCVYPVDCLRSMLWECVWINCVRCLAVIIRTPDSTFLELLKGWPLLHSASLPIRSHARLIIQKDFGVCCTPFIKAVLEATSIQTVHATPLYGVMTELLESATAVDAGVSEAGAYWAFINTLYPCIAKSADMKTRNGVEIRLTSRRNWEVAIQMDHEQLQKLISIGMCCVVPDFDASFRLWFWRFCEMSDNTLSQGVSLLLCVVFGALMENVSHNVTVSMLQKLASLLRIPNLRRHAGVLLMEEETDTEWRPELFEAVLQLVRTGPVYTERNWRIFLQPVGRILAHLVDALSLSRGSSVGVKLREIASAVVCRLQRESSVPVILCLWPVLEQFFQTDPGILAFLNETTSQPVLNWLLVGIAQDLRCDASVSFLVDLAEKVITGFQHLAKRPPDSRSVSLEDLRTSANMVVAYTRNYDADRPTYRIPQNRDPVAILCGDTDDQLPETFAKFQHLVLRMMSHFSPVDNAAGRYFQRKSSGRTGAVSPIKKADILVKQRYTRLVSSSESTDQMDVEYGQWQEREVKFHLFVEQNASSISDVDDEMMTRFELEEWLRRKTGVIATVLE